MLLAHFLRRPAGKLCHGFSQTSQVQHRVAEGAGVGNLLLGLGAIVQADAGHALQFAHRALQHHRPGPPNRGRVHAHQVLHRLDTAFAQLLADTPADAPHFADVGGLKHHLQFGRCQGGQVADLGQVVRVDAGLALRRLGDVIGQFGQGLGGANANAAGDADPLQDARPDLVAACHQIATHPVETDEGLVDAVDLLGWPQAGGQAHHAVANVAVQGKVGRERHQAVGLDQMPDLKPGGTHLDAQRFGLVAAGNGAAVVVAQHHGGNPVQAGPEDAFTADVEVVAVNQGVHQGTP